MGKWGPVRAKVVLVIEHSWQHRLYTPMGADMVLLPKTSLCDRGNYVLAPSDEIEHYVACIPKKASTLTQATLTHIDS